tara:strand:+ start:516 stop:698 length:183 start_codon:yes stop_codon:yes gene_type:complete
MKVGDLVILEYEGVDLKEKERLKIGIVSMLLKDEIAMVLWSNGKTIWNLKEHLEVISESR